MKTTKNSAVPKERVRDRSKTTLALKLAIHRFEKKGLALSVPAIASEIGVNPSLIYNTYPVIANEIRIKTGRTPRQQLDAKAAELNNAKDRLRVLTKKLSDSRADNVKLASINETLRHEIATLRGLLSDKVTVMPDRKTVKTVPD
ncbi:TetR family transcriptional regulator [Paraburkholderia strydomiana]|uniref:TetR family transcriptional regulator n=1 Tax=Paraburkholderia strydomiana TaxID=1245417 RepID=UPI0038BD00C0